MESGFIPLKAAMGRLATSLQTRIDPFFLSKNPFKRKYVRAYVRVYGNERLELNQ